MTIWSSPSVSWELGARIRSLLRRSGTAIHEGTDAAGAGGPEDESDRDGAKHQRRVLSYNDIVVDERKHEAEVGRGSWSYQQGVRSALLSDGEASFVATRDEKLLNAVWGYDYDGESRTVDMHIKSLHARR